MPAIAAFHSRFPRGGDVSDAKVRGQKPPFWWVTRTLMTVVVIALVMLVFNSVRQSWIADGHAQGKEAAEQTAKAKLDQQRDEIVQLKSKIEELQGQVNGLRGELKTARNQSDGLAEQLRLANAKRSQAVSDLKTTVTAVANAKGAPVKKASPPPRQRRS